ncbi:hypothetical protein NQ314_019971 [Rhamnusium bicolor]|uniref:Uncharacterized protein n=1 Tax=Rhamnusium bicolor TaxID=1586634 RepID=A0AAV8WMP4_9CUCU|nr:hypothetical protein NQ314_019971 [Rhamnusium bicolor]
MYERIEFYDARQIEGEKISEWYARVYNLSTNCEFGNSLKQIVRHRFVCGMLKGKIRVSICEEKLDVDLQRLLELALSKEITI